jgi:hypothetical protein
MGKRALTILFISLSLLYYIGDQIYPDKEDHTEKTGVDGDVSCTATLMTGVHSAFRGGKKSVTVDTRERHAVA